MFTVIIHRKALKEIDRLPADDRTRLLNAIREMTEEPFAGDIKPIRDVKGVLRRRVGDYRIAFFISAFLSSASLAINEEVDFLIASQGPNFRTL